MDVDRVGVLRYIWQTPRPKSNYGPQWSDAMFAAIFNDRNGWSVGDYWERVTGGLIRPEFTFLPWSVLRHEEAAQGSNRGAWIQLAKDQAASDGWDLTPFRSIIAFIHSMPSNAGSVGSYPEGERGRADALFNHDADLEFYQHEVGHVLGLRHAFGPPMYQTLGAYNDPYCVMGSSGPNSRMIAADPALATMNLPKRANFWRSGRRPSSATLYRWLPSFAGTAQVRRLAPGDDLVLTAGSDASPADATLGVLPIHRGELTVEYRRSTGDDAGMRNSTPGKPPVQAPVPAVVLRTTGTRDNPAGQDEIRPAWFEVAMSPTPGGSETVFGHRVEVLDASADGRTVTVRVGRSPLNDDPGQTERPVAISDLVKDKRSSYAGELDPDAGPHTRLSPP